VIKRLKNFGIWNNGQAPLRRSILFFFQVVCEKMEWLPFYLRSPQFATHGKHGNMMGKVGKVEKQTTVIIALCVLCGLMASFSIIHGCSNLKASTLSHLFI
jgi:hypothetical protein